MNFINQKYFSIQKSHGQNKKQHQNISKLIDFMSFQTKIIQNYLSLRTGKLVLMLIQKYFYMFFYIISNFYYQMDINQGILPGNTATNFFNSTQGQLNPFYAQTQNINKQNVVNIHQQKLHTFQNVSSEIQVLQQQPISDMQQIHEGRDKMSNLKPMPKYGNHRSKTTRGFERANIKLALKDKQRQSNRYYKGKLVSYAVSEQYFSVFSPGIYLFFAFIKRLSILFFILSLIYLVPLIYTYVKGSAFQNAKKTFQINIAKMMLGNQKANQDKYEQLKDKIFITLPDIFGILIFFAFCIYWSRFSSKCLQKLKKKFKYISDQTIQVTNFPKQVSEQEIQKFFIKYGNISQVAPVKNYEEMIELSRKIYEKSLKIKQKLLTTRKEIQSQQQINKFNLELQKDEQKINQLLEQLGRIQSNYQNKNIKYYVKFQQLQSRTHVLEDYQPYNRIFKCLSPDAPQQLKLHGIVPKIKRCKTQPSQIIWQNMHIKTRNRIIRFLLQFILIVCIIIIGFTIILFLNISTPPTSYSNLSIDNITLAQLKSMDNFSVSYMWCIDNLQLDGDFEEVQYCSPYRRSYSLRLFLTIGISLLIILIKQILKHVMIKIAHFQRYKNHTELSTNIMTNLFVIYISTTFMITFLLQANIFGISFKNLVKIFLNEGTLLNNMNSLQEYNDFTNNWYKDIGYQIWMNWLILSLFPHIFMPFYHIIMQKIGNYMAKKQKLQKNVKKWMQLQQFEIEDNYADILMLVFVGFSFSGGIPFMSVFTFIGLITRFLYYKYAFIRFCRIPKYYRCAMNERSIFIMKIVLIFHVCISIWMFGVKQIFGEYQNATVNVGNQNLSNGLSLIATKIVANWYLSCLLGCFIVLFIFHKLAMKIIKKSCQNQDQNSQKIKRSEQFSLQKKLRKHTDDSYGQDGQQLKITQVSDTQSYKIQKNPRYFAILAIMKPQQVQNFLQKTMQLKCLNLNFHLVHQNINKILSNNKLKMTI